MFLLMRWRTTHLRFTTTFVKRATLFKYCRVLKRIALSQAFNTVVYFWSDICAAALVIWSVSRCLILWKLASRGSCCLCDHSSRWTHLLDYFCSTLSYVRYSKLNWSHRYSVHVEANIALHFEANITVLEAHRSFDKPLLVCWSDVCAAAPFIWSVRRFFFLKRTSRYIYLLLEACNRRCDCSFCWELATTIVD